MKKVIALAALGSLTAWTHAYAEWTFVTHNETLQISVFVDYETIRAERDVRKALELWNYETRTQDGELSTLVQSEFDCAQGRKRMLQFTLHSERDGAGQVIYSEDVSDTWKLLSPRSVGYVLLKDVCTR